MLVEEAPVGALLDVVEARYELDGAGEVPRFIVSTDEQVLGVVAGKSVDDGA